MVSTKFRVTHAHPATHARNHARASSTVQTSDDCRTGKTKFITSPTLGSSVPVSSPLKVTWDSSCLPATTAVKILLYAPGTDAYLSHYWDGLDIKRGEFDITIDPSWYNNTASQQLQISVVPSDLAFAALLDLPAGPVITATYNGTTSTSSSTSSAPSSTQSAGAATFVNDFAAKAISAGKIAAAVLLPIIFLSLLIATILKYKRKRSKEKRMLWSEKVDRRMSTISADWKSVTPSGAKEAIRNSMAAGTIRGSVYSASVYSGEGGENQAGVGVRGGGATTGVGLRHPPPRPSGESRVSFADSAPRQSRVSFADAPRPSMERKSRAFHVGHVPPVPALPNITTDVESREGEGEMSPRQAVGAMSLTPEDIRARIARNAAKREEEAGRKDGDGGMEGDEVLAALSLMRTGGATASTDDLLLTPSIPMPSPVYTPCSTIAHAPTYTSPTSPVMGSIPMPNPMPQAMSPDDMLRAYAERRRLMGAVSPPPTLGGKGISYPMPVASVTSGGPMIFAAQGQGQVGEWGQLEREEGKEHGFGGAKYVVGDDEDAYAYGGTA